MGNTKTSQWYDCGGGATASAGASRGTRVETAASPKAKGRRLQSLDLMRGLTVVGMIVVNATAALSYVANPVFPILLHAHWAGFTAADAVFPAFITMVGVSIAISARPQDPLPPQRILWRAARLILLGLILVNLYLPIAPEAWPPRFPGVLQRIGIVYAIVAYVYPRTSLRARAIAAGALLLGYWGLCLLPIPGGPAVDLLAPGRDLPSWVDRQVFGSWIGEKGQYGFDPEGLLSTLPVIAQALIGTIAGDWLRQGVPIATLSRRLALAGVAGIALALLWNPLFPIVKSIWTSSFVLISAGITLLGLALFHRLYDEGNALPRKGGLFGSFGRNAITAYALHYVVINLVMTSVLRAPMVALTPVIGHEWAALAPVAIFLALIWLPIAVMDRKGWYLKI
jgi:predicted acyltransferase